jgi:hypothetical protein
MKFLCLGRHINLDSLHEKLQADYDLKRERFWSNTIAMNSNPLPDALSHEKLNKNQKKRKRKANKVLNLQSLQSKRYFRKVNINTNAK